MPQKGFGYYSDNAIASSSEEEPSPMLNPSAGVPAIPSDTDSLSPRHSNLSMAHLHSIPQISPEHSVSPLSQIREDMSLQTSTAVAANDEGINLRMPDFNKRPPSDTPAGSNNTSPAISNVNSEVTSQENSPDVTPTINNVLNVPPIRLSKRRATAINLPGITKHSSSGIFEQEASSKLVIVMVGLPARGKSYITSKLTRYLNWLQHECRVFNVGNTRRKDAAQHGPSKGPLPDTSNHTDHDASFFNPENQESTKIREKWAIDTLDSLLDYLLLGSGSVGIFDATNSTKSRRRTILSKIRERSPSIKVMFLESICTDNDVIQKNVRLKLSGPDYRDMDPELALKDFTERLHNYEKAYQTLEDDEGLQYIKMIDVGKKVVAYNIQGFLASQAIYYLLNFNLNERQIWITRHGESEDNVSGRIGGDAPLTKRGEKFAKALANFIEHEKTEFRKKQVEKYTELIEHKEADRIPDEPLFNVWTSMLQRAVQSSDFFPEDQFDIREMRMLNELCAGTCEGLTYEEIQRKYPDEYNSRIMDKLRYRYPGIGGESYLDVINRVRPIINEVERTTDHVLLITHRVVARVLLGYFMNLSRDAITSLDIPLHCVYLLEPKPYGVEWTLYEYSEKDDWFYKVSDDQIHKKKFKEVSVAFRERKYSVVPTAPPKISRNVSMGQSSAAANERQRFVSGNPTNDLNRTRRVPAHPQAAPQQSQNQSPSTIEAEKLAEKLNKLKT